LLDEPEFRRWMESARKTLMSAERDVSGGDYNWACFKAHQASEKALKAILWGIGKPCIGHSLTHLLNYLSESLEDQVPEDILDASITLSRYYTPTRYPDAWSEGIPEEYYSKKDAEEAINLSKKLVEWVENVWRRLSGKEL